MAGRGISRWGEQTAAELDGPGYRPLGSERRMLYLAYLDGHDLGPSIEGPWVEVHRLRPGLLLLASEQSRSAVYHALKDHLPRDTPLLVAACDEIPKFKGMAPGALTFARRHVDAGSEATDELHR